MAFTQSEKEILHKAHGVGPMVIQRLEEVGFNTLPQLAQADAQHICELIAAHVGSTCWKNSPQSRRSVQSAIGAAKSHVIGE